MLFIFNVCKNKIHIFKTQYLVEVIVIWCLNETPEDFSRGVCVAHHTRQG